MCSTKEHGCSTSTGPLDRQDGRDDQNARDRARRLDLPSAAHDAHRSALGLRELLVASADRRNMRAHDLVHGVRREPSAPAEDAARGLCSKLSSACGQEHHR